MFDQRDLTRGKAQLQWKPLWTSSLWWPDLFSGCQGFYATYLQHQRLHHHSESKSKHLGQICWGFVWGHVVGSANMVKSAHTANTCSKLVLKMWVVLGNLIVFIAFMDRKSCTTWCNFPWISNVLTVSTWYLPEGDYRKLPIFVWWRVYGKCHFNPFHSQHPKRSFRIMTSNGSMYTKRQVWFESWVVPPPRMPCQFFL